MGFPEVEALRNINLNGHCLFCLRGNCDVEVQHEQKQVLELLFKSVTPVVGFQRFFWELLLGPSLFRKDVSQEQQQDRGSPRDVIVKTEVDTEVNSNPEQESCNGSFSYPSLCGRCFGTLQTVRKLHEDLERIQMLLIYHISTVQQNVKQCCQGKDEHWDAKMGGSDEGRFEALRRFQESVVAQSTSSGKLPLVFLDKFKNSNRIEKLIEMSQTSDSTAIVGESEDMLLPNTNDDNDVDWRPNRRPASSRDACSIPKKRGRPRKHFTIEEKDLKKPKTRGRPRKLRLENCKGLHKGSNIPKPSTEVIKMEVSPSRRNSKTQTYRRGRRTKIQRDLDKLGNVLLDIETFNEPAQPTTGTEKSFGDSENPENCANDKQECDSDWSPTNMSSASSDEEGKALESRRKNFTIMPTRTSKLPGTSTGRPRIPNKSKGVKNYRLIKRKPSKTTLKRQHHRWLTCETCGKMYFSKIAFFKHKREHVCNNVIEDPTMDRKVCQICSESIDQSEYYEHLLSHENNNEEKPYACTIKDCVRKFQIEENLKIHVEIDHYDLDLNFRTLIVIKKCDVCNICYDSSFLLLDHMKRVHKDRMPSLFRCPVCEYCFTIADNLISHMHTHTMVQQQICFVCKSNCQERSKLLEHLSSHHGMQVSNSCSLCQEQFQDPYWYKVHMISAHKRKETFVCSYCGKVCAYAPGFMRHMRVHERQEKLGFQCQEAECPESFTTEDKLTSHRVKVHGCPKPQCELCGKEFIYPSAKAAHLRAHRNKGYHCKICDKYFERKAYYQKHVTGAHSDGISFPCEICGFAAKSKERLWFHRLIHDKQYSCDICGRKFARKHYLTNHMRMHTGETILCPFCGYEFHSKKSCQKHINTYHSGDNPRQLPPEKKRSACKTWKDFEGNVFYAKNLPKNEKTSPAGQMESESTLSLSNAESVNMNEIEFQRSISEPSTSSNLTLQFQSLPSSSDQM